ncbi:hypothetical protein DF3PA_70121 [Candidatus Defluviicoccus seviourii]|uniref:Uncharacterized protein n=1 Tax=Candidatus Defluviicoccus seviourii TaxID=2565273 RepID=A0A564WH56_9PROT|nr:hypothetical protein DF3PA_70121 [Candidatus Defluviicoccus seviourii]
MTTYARRPELVQESFSVNSRDLLRMVGSSDLRVSLIERLLANHEYIELSEWEAALKNVIFTS